MKNKSVVFSVLAALAALAASSIATPSFAAGVTFKNGDKYIKIGGRI